MNNPFQKRRHGKIVKRAAELMNCSRRSIYNYIYQEGVEVFALRLRNHAPADNPDIALEIETLAAVFESEVHS